MDFKETYAPTSEKDKPENKDKKIISDDAYALGDMLNYLIKKIEQTRISLLK